MRTAKVLSVSLPPELHSCAEKVARSESRARSGLIREALRAYQTLRLRTENEQHSKSKLTDRGPQRSQ